MLTTSAYYYLKTHYILWLFPNISEKIWNAYTATGT